MAAEETEDEVPDSGAVFTFGKSKFAENVPNKFWLKNDKPVHIVCGDEHTALVTGNGKLYVFGSNDWGQLGMGSGNTITKPTCVKALKSEKVQFAACGRNHTLVYTAQGRVFSAGGNSEGQLGLGHADERTGFQEIPFFTNPYKIKHLSAGSNTSAALTVDGKLFMWGDNSEGQIGLANEANVSVPHEVDVKKPISWVSCGYYHSALVTKDGELYTFGEPENGKLGLSSKQLMNNKVPQLVSGISGKVNMVACGGGHTVVLAEHSVYTFGFGQFGQLGHGTFMLETPEPKVVDALKKHKVSSINCGENHTAVITDSGLLYTFGDGRHGKLGLGEETFTNQFIPTLCKNFLKFTVHAVACGGCHMLVFATPRPKGSEDLIIEDLKENALAVANVGGDASSASPLHRSLSARHRRRERELSPEQDCRLTKTLPPLAARHLNSSMPIPSKTIPSRLPSMNHNEMRETSKSPIQELTTSSKTESKTQLSLKVEDVSGDEISDGGSQHGGLGDTIDPLNMTHVISVNPVKHSLEISPVPKRKEPSTLEDEETEEEAAEGEEVMDDDIEETEQKDKEEKVEEVQDDDADDDEEKELDDDEDEVVEEKKEDHESEKKVAENVDKIQTVKEDYTIKPSNEEKNHGDSVSTNGKNKAEEQTVGGPEEIKQAEENSKVQPVQNSPDGDQEKNDGKAGEIRDGKKKVSLFKRKSSTSQKSMLNNEEAEPKVVTPSRKKKGKTTKVDENDSKDENQNKTKKNHKEITQANKDLLEMSQNNEDKKSKSGTCIIL